jgi:hypothetical protein
LEHQCHRARFKLVNSGILKELGARGSIGSLSRGSG